MTGFENLSLTSSHWGTYRARVRVDRVEELRAFEHDADPSPIGPGILEVQHGPTRVDAPLIRQSWLEGGPGARAELRGKDRFVRVGWEEANRLVAAELERVRSTHGNRAIFGGSYCLASAGRFHHEQSQLKRFLNCIGGFTGSKFTYNFAAAEAMIPHVLGSFRAYPDTCTSYEAIRAHTGLFVCFGGVPQKNGQISQGGTGCHIQRNGVMAAVGEGVKFVNISPIKSDLAHEAGGAWLALRPKTDVALMLGLAHTLHAEGLTDEVFLTRYATGFERFLPYMTGATDGVTKSDDWAAQITGLPASTIRDLAWRMAAERSMISVSWSLTRQDHGEQPFWMAITLAAMLGQIGLPGGGFGFGYSAMNYIGGDFSVLPSASLPQGKNPVADFIPVARISDLLLRPGAAFDFDGGTYQYPDIRLVWWAGGNPFHHHQDLNHLMQAWRKPETIIVNEWCWNPLAKRADIVLPCTTPLEREDIAMTPRDPFVVAMSQLTKPFGESRDDFDIFAGIAREMGLEEVFSEGRGSSEWQRRIYDRTRAQAAAKGIGIPGYDTLFEKGWFKLDDPPEPVVMLKDFRDDPKANPLATPTSKIEIFSRTVASFNYDDCPGHPVWRAFDAQGACLAGAVLDANLRPGVVQMSAGAWYDPDESGLCKHGNPNVLTRDKGTSRLGQGPSAQSCLIEVELYTAASPAVTAHAPPTILRRSSEETKDQT